MLGYPTGGSFDINTFRTQQAKYYAVFVQDDFRPRSNLTSTWGCGSRATSGLRSGSTGRSPASTRRRTLPITAAVQAAYAAKPVAGGGPGQLTPKGGLLFAGANGNTIYSPKYGYFSPRFGLAWTPGGAGHGR